MKLFKSAVLFAIAISGNLVAFAQTNTPCSAGSPIAPALPVNAACAYTAGTTVGLTYASNAANGGVPSCASPGAPDGWYTFTAPASGSVTITTAAGSMTDAGMSLYSGTCGAFTEIACSDDVIGFMPQISASGLTPGATYFVRIWSYFSGTGTFSICITTSAAAGDPCASITPIGACGTSVTNSVSGSGSWNILACGFTTSGMEEIYSFTPTVTGTYSLNVSSASGGYVDYFWINSTSGCSSGAAWNCIDDVFSAGTYGAMSWTAGQTYYILLDPEPTGATSQTFSINCIAAGGNPCTSITDMGGCGASVTANMSGTGAPWNITACGFSTPGDEVIFSFTPTTTGVHTINVTSLTGGFIDFFYVNSASGCSSTAGWTCIDDVFGTGNLPGINLTAGVTYYILLDPENTAGSTATFSVQCPGSGGAVTAGDCTAAVNVCTNLTFAVDPSGFGAVNELCTGCTSNPSTNPSGVNSGCLLSGELNSTWMVVNISSSGTLEFSFGTDGGSVCYDWIMWPYTSTSCASISSNTLAPTRCNWNAPCEGFTGMGTLPAGGDPGNFQPALNVTAGQQYVICFSNYSSATTTVPLNFFGTAGVSCSPLPVELVSFNGFKLNKEVKLVWEANSEPTTTHYEIMHSTDGINYTLIGTVEANSASNISNAYDFIHTKPAFGLNYYKLGMVDNQNRMKESGEVVINFDPEAITIGEVYPNPTSGMSYLNIYSADETTMLIHITDISGKTVVTQVVSLLKGSNKIEINTSLLAAGIYNFSVSHPENIAAKVQKLIIE